MPVYKARDTTRRQWHTFSPYILLNKRNVFLYINQQAVYCSVVPPAINNCYESVSQLSVRVLVVWWMSVCMMCVISDHATTNRSNSDRPISISIYPPSSIYEYYYSSTLNILVVYVRSNIRMLTYFCCCWWCCSCCCCSRCLIRRKASYYCYCYTIAAAVTMFYVVLLYVYLSGDHRADTSVRSPSRTVCCRCRPLYNSTS